MYCKNCGYEIEENAVFCTGCGTRIYNYNQEEFCSGASSKQTQNLFSVFAIIFSIISAIFGLISIIFYFDGFFIFNLTYLIFPLIFAYLIIKKKKPDILVISYFALLTVTLVLDKLYISNGSSLFTLLNPVSVLSIACLICAVFSKIKNNSKAVMITTTVFEVLIAFYNILLIITFFNSYLHSSFYRPGIEAYSLYSSVHIALFALAMSINTIGQVFNEKSIQNRAITYKTANNYTQNSESFNNAPIITDTASKNNSGVNIVLNVFWAIFGGLIYSFSWLVTGALWCITIIGIPIGKQCFKFAKLMLAPFGKEIVYGGNTVKVIINIIWLIFTGLWSAIAYAITGLALCITLIGIPLGLQYFKLAKLMLMPFGAQIVEKQ